MKLNDHAKAFLLTYSFSIQGDETKVQGSSDTRKLSLRERVVEGLGVAIILTFPILNTGFGATVINDMRKKGIKNERDKAELACGIIAVTGLGVLLIPVFTIGTIARVIFNATRKEEDKLYDIPT